MFAASIERHRPEHFARLNFTFGGFEVLPLTRNLRFQLDLAQDPTAATPSCQAQTAMAAVGFRSRHAASFSALLSLSARQNSCTWRFRLEGLCEPQIRSFPWPNPCHTEHGFDSYPGADCQSIPGRVKFPIPH